MIPAAAPGGTLWVFLFFFLVVCSEEKWPVLSDFFIFFISRGNGLNRGWLGSGACDDPVRQLRASAVFSWTPSDINLDSTRGRGGGERERGRERVDVISGERQEEQLVKKNTSFLSPRFYWIPLEGRLCAAPPLLKATLCTFSTLKWQFQDQFVGFIDL